jgi:glyoxylase-like metal-dependent hydrolase (beta-lactamase superfamily II)
VADEAEQFEPVWVRPAEALARHAAGQFFIIFPTIRTLERLQAYRTVDEVLAACAGEQPLWTSCPRAGLLHGHEARYMEHEPPYGELALVCPDGQIVHELDWQTERPVPLLKNVQRLTAPNPGVMTGPGTNSYLVGDPDTGYIAIDPGPADPEHLERCGAPRAATSATSCAPIHPDHSPGAAPLQALCGARPPAPRSWACPRPHGARGQRVHARTRAGAWRAPAAALGAAPPTPCGAAHARPRGQPPVPAAEEDGLLFSGDHILNGSTTVVDPPDGNMADYIELAGPAGRLRRTRAWTSSCPPTAMCWAARAAIARSRRTACARGQGAGRHARTPRGHPEQWVELAYDDVPPACGRWPALAAGPCGAHAQPDAIGLRPGIALCSPLGSRLFHNQVSMGRKLGAPPQPSPTPMTEAIRLSKHVADQAAAHAAKPNC